MNPSLTIVLAQMNATVGDVAANTEKIIALARKAKAEHTADLVLFPELAITGYPPEDLLLRREFLEQVDRHLEKIQAQTPEIAVLVGHPSRESTGLCNSASLYAGGARLITYHKQLLPNYSVFDEKRYFSPGNQAAVTSINGLPIGISICEDIWQPEPAARAKESGARLLLNLNASPFHIDKQQEREQVVGQRSRETGLPILYLNMVGGQDELVFDGSSFVTNPRGDVIQRTPAYVEGLFVHRVFWTDRELQQEPCPLAPSPSLNQSIYQALVTGVRDYVGKNGFRGAIIGLSGGIDSALTLAIAVDALGPERVHAVMMPSAYTSSMSLEDARQESELLGVSYSEIDIEPIVACVHGQLQPHFAGTTRDTTEENIQARARGLLLMALSNKKGMLVLTTGNKTEMAVGYATLYGDMVGGFSAMGSG